MEAKNAGLVVLLTDCCSTPRKLPPLLTESKGLVERARTLRPVGRSLLFQARGTVDITAATDNASCRDNKNGGLSSRPPGRRLQAPLPRRDLGGDHERTWEMVLP